MTEKIEPEVRLPGTLKAAIEASKKVAPTMPSDVIETTRMKQETIRELASTDNLAFSQISIGEVNDIVMALTFADDPIPGANRELKELGIDPIRLPVIEKVIANTIKYRHPTDRRRVEEYIRAIRANNTEQPLPLDTNRGFWGSMRKVV